MSKTARRFSRSNAARNRPQRKNVPQFYNLVTLAKAREQFGLWSRCEHGHVVPSLAREYTCPANRGDGLRCAASLTRLGAMTRADAEALARPAEKAAESRDADDRILQHERAARSGIELP